MHLRYRVDLEESERQQLEGIVAGGTRAVRRVKRAQILLAAAARRDGCGDCHDGAGGDVDGLPHETAVRRGESRGGVIRGPAAGRKTQAHAGVRKRC